MSLIGIGFPYKLEMHATFCGFLELYCLTEI